MATPQQIKTSIENGISWLLQQQAANGSWSPNEFSVSSTGLAVLKLETYALENGFLTPFDPEFPYKSNVEAGLNYIFNTAILDNTNGLYFRDGGYVSYATGIVLSAISASAAPDYLITVGAATGKTFKQAVDLIINYLAYSQAASGGWAYDLSFGAPDNSNSGYAVLGLEFAKSPIYKFNAVIPQTLLTKLNNWINYIQNPNGGSGYTSNQDYVNILKTGTLMQEMHLAGDDLNSARLKKAITYIADHWNDTIKWLQSNGGWVNRDGQGSPTAVDYQAAFTTMKGMVPYGIDKISTTGGTQIDWFAEMADAIVKLQNPGGYWPATQPEDTVLLSTVWALLTLEKAAPSGGYMTYKDTVTVNPQIVICPWDIEKTIDVLGEIKIFAKKYSHSETEANPGVKPSKGDDIGFTLVFGNYGEFLYKAAPGSVTAEDHLYVQSPVNLRLMSLCLCDNYKLFYGNTDKEVKPCDIFYGDIGNYNLQVRKLVEQPGQGVDAPVYKADFDLPCHTICSISMLFQIEFPACPRCPSDIPPV